MLGSSRDVALQSVVPGATVFAFASPCLRCGRLIHGSIGVSVSAPPWAQQQVSAVYEYFADDAMQTVTQHRCKHASFRRRHARRADV